MPLYAYNHEKAIEEILESTMGIFACFHMVIYGKYHTYTWTTIGRHKISSKYI
jgi:hypothetical protein